MEQKVFTEIRVINELSKELTLDDIAKLKLFMKIPAGVCEEISDGGSFLRAMHNWDEFKPYVFYQALTRWKRTDLLSIAINLTWLCVSEPTRKDDLWKNFLPMEMEGLKSLLLSEITKEEFTFFVISNNIYIGVKNDYDNIISTNPHMRFELLEELHIYTHTDDYDDLSLKVSRGECIFKMESKLAAQIKKPSEWDGKLRLFLEITNKNVQQMLGDDQLVNLESVYVELTILRQKPRQVKLEDETTYNEIAYLRKIAKKEIEITPIDFTEELKSCKTEEPEVWCLIGNPGCGKTFLSKRIALRFSQCELKQISYSIAIPCRNTDWHSMESIRVEEDKAVTTEFVQEWLCLGLPVTSDWPKELAKHLAESGGEALLLIIDGLDEFTKKIPFEKSLLYLLLTRQIQHRSTIIVTTRPGAWTDISSQHEFQVDRFYQVLGFSPENRDMYFEKQIVKLDKLKVCRNLLSLYDKMNQLSLIPVNASLFAALLKEESVLINNLTQLYRELTCYLIRRQLSRMGLKELSKVIKLELFDKCVLDCLYTIGRIALMGVSSRELTSTERVTMTINHVEIECHCLGLAHEFHTKEYIGPVKKVWAFAHLTMQEFSSAIFLKSTSWTDQCMSIRYMADSNEHFSLYRNVVRFLCGLLSEKSAALLVICYRQLMPDTINNLPMYHQLGFDGFQLLPYSGWFDFTKIYFHLIPILFEAHSPLTHSFLKRFLPASISLYLNQNVLPVSPNEWLCFIQSLRLVQHIKLLYIDTSHVSIELFASLLKEIQNYPLYQFAVKFEQGYYQTDSTSTKVFAYSKLINSTKFNSNTHISIELNGCKLEDLRNINLFSSTNQHINSVRLNYIKCPIEFVHQLANNVVSSKYFQYLYTNIYEYSDVFLPALTQVTQLKGLYLPDIQIGDDNQLLQELVPKLTELTEFEYSDYSLLPHMTHLTRLTYLDIKNERDGALSANLLQVLNNSHNTLRVVTLWSLHEIGFKNWTELLSSLQCCVNIVKLEISFTSISSEGVSQWKDTLRCLQSLLSLSLHYVTLSDAGLIAVCQGLAKHRSIRSLV